MTKEDKQSKYQVSVQVGREVIYVDGLSWGDAHQIEVMFGLALSGLGAQRAERKTTGRISQLLMGTGKVEVLGEVWRLEGREVALTFKESVDDPQD